MRSVQLGIGLVLGLLLGGSASSEPALPLVSRAEIVTETALVVPASGGRLLLTVTAPPESEVTLDLSSMISGTDGAEVASSIWRRAEEGMPLETLDQSMKLPAGLAARLTLDVPPLAAGNYRTEIRVGPDNRVFDVEFSVAPPPSPPGLPSAFLQPSTHPVVMRPVVIPRFLISPEPVMVALAATNTVDAVIALDSLDTGALTLDGILVQEVDIHTDFGGCKQVSAGGSCLAFLQIPAGLGAGEYRLQVTARGLHGGASQAEITLQVARPWWLASLLVTIGVLAGALYASYHTVIAPRNRVRAELKDLSERARVLAEASADSWSPIAAVAQAIRVDADIAEAKVWKVRKVWTGDDLSSLTTVLGEDLAILETAARARSAAIQPPLAGRLAPLVAALDVAIAATPRNRQAMEEALGQLQTSARLVRTVEEAARTLDAALADWEGALALPGLVLPEQSSAAVKRAREAKAAALAPMTAEASAMVRLVELNAATAALFEAEPGFISAVAEAGLRLLDSPTTGQPVFEDMEAALRSSSRVIASANEASQWARQVVAATQGEQVQEAAVQTEEAEGDVSTLPILLAELLQPRLGTSSKVLRASARVTEVIGLFVIASLSGIAGYQAIIGDNLTWGQPVDQLMAFLAGLITQTAVIQVAKPSQ